MSMDIIQSIIEVVVRNCPSGITYEDLTVLIVTFLRATKADCRDDF